MKTAEVINGHFRSSQGDVELQDKKYFNFDPPKGGYIALN